MKNKIIPILLFSISLASCDWFSFSKYKFDNQEVILNDCSNEQDENSDCAEVSINYLNCKKPSEFAQKFNDTIQKRIIYLLIGEVSEKMTIQEASEQFMNSYKSDNELYGPVPPYQIQVVDSIFFQNDKIITLASYAYEYSGGVHGIGNTTFFNFKPSGECYTNDELFIDREKITQIAEKYFREQIQIKEGQSYSDNGFWFDDDEFQLSQNIGFKGDDMILYYNPYEIAPYSLGSFEIHIPIKEVKEWINIL